MSWWGSHWTIVHAAEVLCSTSKVDHCVCGPNEERETPRKKEYHDLRGHKSNDRIKYRVLNKYKYFSNVA
jgi:hypothetical protein